MEISTAILLAIVLLIGLWVPYLHLVHPSWESTWTHLVHMVEAAGSLRHWAGHWWGPTDSTRRRRCAEGSFLILRRIAAFGCVEHMPAREGENRASPTIRWRSRPGGPLEI